MGALYLVATPIGNLEDITLRALRVLREVRLVAAEDTRHTRKLLNHFQIDTPCISYHQHSGPARVEALLSELERGDLALVSDAGTPVISDPGEEVVRAALAAGYAVVPVPGPVAAISALIASGLPAAQFTYLGFLPRRQSERRALLESVRDEPRSLVFYEAPHRLLACLSDLLHVLGDRPAVLARELTKVHEEWLRGSLSTLAPRLADNGGARGEFTIVVAGAPPAPPHPKTAATDAPDTTARARQQLQQQLARGVRTRDAAAIVASALGLPRREVYRLALEVVSQRAGG